MSTVAHRTVAQLRTALALFAAGLHALLARGCRHRRDRWCLGLWVAATALAVSACAHNKGQPADNNAKFADAPSVAPPADRDYAGGDAGDGGGGYARDYAGANPSSAPGPKPSALGTSADDSPVRSRRSARRGARRDRHAQSATPRPTPRPGLGTAYGEQRHSRVVSTSFVREHSAPDVVLSLWYNDWQGIESMGNAIRHGSTPSVVGSSDGAFSISLIDEHGNTLPAADIEGRRYAAGQAGTRYKIQITNNSAFRFEVVASVDGLDVIDGDEAQFHKRGYVLDAWSSLTVDGWRTSDDTIAAFRFSGIEDSYAERTGKGRNVGVVGVAFFHERGAPSWDELHRRHTSEPFNGGYAPPPPPRRWR